MRRSINVDLLLLLLLLLLAACALAAPKPPIVLIVARPRTGSSSLCWQLPPNMRRSGLPAVCVGEFLHQSDGEPLYEPNREFRSLCWQQWFSQQQTKAMHKCLVALRDGVLKRAKRTPRIVIGKLFDYDLGLHPQRFGAHQLEWWVRAGMGAMFERLISFPGTVPLVVMLRRTDSLMQHVSFKWASEHNFWQASALENRTGLQPMRLTRLDAEQIELDFEHSERESAFLRSRHDAASPPKARLIEIESTDVFYRMQAVSKLVIANLLDGNATSALDLRDDAYNFEHDQAMRLQLLRERVANVDEVLGWLRQTRWAERHRPFYYR